MPSVLQSISFVLVATACHECLADGAYPLRVGSAVITPHAEIVEAGQEAAILDLKLLVTGEGARCIVNDPFFGAVGRSFAAIRLTVPGTQSVRFLDLEPICDPFSGGSQFSQALGPVAVRQGQVVGRRINMKSFGGNGTAVDCTVQVVLYDGIAVDRSGGKTPERVVRPTTTDMVAVSHPVTWNVDPTSRIHCSKLADHNGPRTDVTVNYTGTRVETGLLSFQFCFINNSNQCQQVFDPMFQYKDLAWEPPRTVRILHWNTALERFEQVSRPYFVGKSLPVTSSMYWQLPPDGILGCEVDTEPYHGAGKYAVELEMLSNFWRNSEQDGGPLDPQQLPAKRRQEFTLE